MLVGVVQFVPALPPNAVSRILGYPLFDVGLTGGRLHKCSMGGHV